jgi:HK97 family phage major capsid protein
MNLNDLYEKRMRLDKEQRDLNDAVLERDGVYTEEEQAKWDKMDTDFNDLSEKIKSLEAQEEKRKKKAAELAARGDLSAPEIEEAREEQPEREVAVIPAIEGRYADVFAEFRKETGGRFATESYKDAFNKVMRGEVRALQADVDVSGGFIAAPEDFRAELIQDKDRMVFIRQFGRVFSVPKAESLGFPELDNDPADPTWTAEIQTGTEDSTMSFEKRALYPHPLAKRIKVSERLLRASVIPVEQLVRERLSYKFAITEESAFLTGLGAGEPLGVMTASDMGISTGRDVSTDNTSSQIKADNLIRCKYTLEAQYRTNCRWIFHRDAISMIRRLKDGEGQYLWKAGLGDKPDTILEFPVHESEYQKNTFSASQYVGILGDFSYYWIADSLDIRIQVLTELYAETAQVGYIARQEVDGMPVHEKGFVRVKLGS